MVHAKLPTAAMVAWGEQSDGRSFVIFDDLSGYVPCDKLIEGGQIDFEALLGPTADMVRRLHDAGLHHRDLYLCHFLAHIDDHRVVDLRLIDLARVRRLPCLTHRRWIIKDLAQFCFSIQRLGISDEQRGRWLARYAGGQCSAAGRLERAIARKIRRMARHDVHLRAEQPHRNVSIPPMIWTWAPGDSPSADAGDRDRTT